MRPASTEPVQKESTGSVVAHNQSIHLPSYLERIVESFFNLPGDVERYAPEESTI